MPFIIAEASSVPVGRTLDGHFCSANVNGLPDRRHRVPVRVTRLSEGALLIEPNDRRTIISTTTEGSRTTFHIEPGRAAQVAAVRLARLATTAQLLEQLTCALTALEPPDEVAGGLKPLADWLGAEREKVTDGSHEHAR